MSWHGCSPFPILGALGDSVMDSAWFFDTNFHLNADGAQVNTFMMAAQLQAALGLPQQHAIVLPDQAQACGNTSGMTVDEESSYFVAEIRAEDVCITGLTPEGARQTMLTLPSYWNEKPVTTFTASTFAGNTVIRQIVLPDTIRRIDDGAFAQCVSLEKVILEQNDPSQITVGNGLFKGTSCFVMVPRNAYSQYQTNYFWSVHAARIRPVQSGASQPQLQLQEPVSGPAMYVDANGGGPIHANQQLAFAISKTHLRTNTPMGQQLFRRDGYAPLCWNTMPDGSGEDIAFGSRMDSAADKVLYMKWVEETPEELLSWEVTGETITVTGWHGHSSWLVIPEMVSGMPVTAIADHAFEGASMDVVVLPPTLRTVGVRAFAGSMVQTLWLYDSLTAVSRDCLEDCNAFSTLCMRADTAPRYAKSYYAAFGDKMDWIRQCQSSCKIILAGGSATRYAYDSKRLKSAFPTYEPVNMGVYAYTNMLPQYLLMLQFVQPGDVLLSAPEFDATQTQFCVSNALDEHFWAMMEADYGNAALLDLRQFSNVAGSLQAYLRARLDMLPTRWEDTPRHYDDDGNEILYETYNRYGDYTLVREGAAADVLLQHIRADYSVEAFSQPMVESLNAVYRLFEERNVRVFFTYAPRNHSALTEASTDINRRRLHQYLEQTLCVPLLLDIEDSLYPGQYFYLIDNHLSDDGAYLHTRRIIQALQHAGL